VVVDNPLDHDLLDKLKSGTPFPLEKVVPRSIGSDTKSAKNCAWFQAAFDATAFAAAGPATTIISCYDGNGNVATQTYTKADISTGVWSKAAKYTVLTMTPQGDTRILRTAASLTAQQRRQSSRFLDAVQEAFRPDLMQKIQQEEAAEQRATALCPVYSSVIGSVVHYLTVVDVSLSETLQGLIDTITLVYNDLGQNDPEAGQKWALSLALELVRIQPGVNRGLHRIVADVMYNIVWDTPFVGEGAHKWQCLHEHMLDWTPSLIAGLHHK